MKQFTYQSPDSGVYNIQLSLRLKASESVIFGKYIFKRKILKKPKWWQFWMREEILEEQIPVEIKPEDIVFFQATRP